MGLTKTVGFMKGEKRRALDCLGPLHTDAFNTNLHQLTLMLTRKKRRYRLSLKIFVLSRYDSQFALAVEISRGDDVQSYHTHWCFSTYGKTLLIRFTWRTRLIKISEHIWQTCWYWKYYPPSRQLSRGRKEPQCLYSITVLPVWKLFTVHLPDARVQYLVSCPYHTFSVLFRYSLIRNDEPVPRVRWSSLSTFLLDKAS